MINRKIELTIKDNIEYRLVNAVSSACEYSSSIYLLTNDKKINVKSLMGMFSIIASAGDTMTLIADGHDEEAAVETVAKWLTIE